MSLSAAEQATLIFGAMDTLLATTGLRFHRDARPIAFEMLSGGGVWSFNPVGGRALFVNADSPDAALRVFTVPEVLGRLLFTPGFTLGPDDPWFFTGDPTALEPLIESLAVRSPLSVRAAQPR